MHQKFITLKSTSFIYLMFLDFFFYYYPQLSEGSYLNELEKTNNYLTLADGVFSPLFITLCQKHFFPR